MDQLISDLLDTRCIEAGPLVVVPEAELPPYVLGDLEIHYAQRRVSVAGRPVQLTATEYELLRALSRNAARVASGPVRVMRRENASVKKSDIAAQVADKTSVSKGDAEAAVNAVLGTITDALARGEPVSIAGFGTFSVTERAARQGRNPRTGESIEIAASTVPAFKVGKTLRGAVA